MTHRRLRSLSIIVAAGVLLGTAAVPHFSAMRGIRKSFGRHMQMAAAQMGVPVYAELLTIVSDPDVLTVSVPVDLEEFPSPNGGQDTSLLYIQSSNPGRSPVPTGHYLRRVYTDLTSDFPVTPTCVELVDSYGNVAAVLEGTHEFVPGLTIPGGDTRAKECDPASCGTVGHTYCCTQSCTYTAINEICISSDCIKIPDSGGSSRESCNDR